MWVPAHWALTSVLALIGLTDAAGAATCADCVRRAEILELGAADGQCRAVVRALEGLSRDTSTLIVLDRVSGALVAAMSSFVQSGSNWIATTRRASGDLHGPLPAAAACEAYWIDETGLRAELSDGPAGGEFFTSINSVGPGNQTAWLNAGALDGCRVGDTWWMRINGQPAARFETLLVAPTRSFARVTLLAADVPMRPSGRVAVWPSPHDERSGRMRSALARLESHEGMQVAWAARPPGPALPRDTHVEFKRRGETLALGMLERSDELFSYVRVVALLPPVLSSPASPVGLELQVGTALEFRTQADVREGRFLPRVFRMDSGRWLINAGEPEGLKLGESGVVSRNGQRVGTAHVERVQSGYSIIRPDHPEVQLLIGDAWKRDGADSGPHFTATVSEIVDGRLLRARIEPLQSIQSGELLAVYLAGRVAAVACVVRADSASLIAVVLCATQQEEITTGAVLMASE